TDQNLAMKPYALLNFLQDIASENAEQWGFGYSYIYPKNYAWFLLKYRMEFDEYPFDVQDLELTTEPRGYNKLFAYREFELRNKEKRVGRMFSMWSLVDIDNRSMVPISSIITNNRHMTVYEKRDTDLSFQKVTPVTDAEIEKEFEVRYNDLDVNGHANNGNYIVWAFEPLSYEFKNEHKIKTLDMVFKKEARFGEQISSQIQFKDENTTLHRLQNKDGEDLCLIECLWDKV
ncbi:MAG: hypothetical protein K6E29_08010, partial [Cyanobacteria bacterium RUI128]|nr:hypothetical protein [Cyanobacteria bacterium RUI128]